jgi:hypothetical protein
MPARPIRAAGKMSKHNAAHKSKKSKTSKKSKKSKNSHHRGGNPERTYTNSKTGASYTRPHHIVPESDSTENYTEHPSVPMTGGAIYSFDLDDKIGGQPANISLNGTQDGDCPSTGALDLGFTNYGLTKGGSYKKNNKKHRKNKTIKNKKSNRSRSNKTKSRRYKK